MSVRPKVLLGQEPACWLAPSGCAHCRARESGREFRRGMMLRVRVPNNDVDFDCPYGVPWGVAIADAPAGLAARSEDDADRFRVLWAELHQRPMVMSTHVAEVAWHAGFARRLPCGKCRVHWRQLLHECPPDWSSQWAYFRWTVAAHNAVSRRLGKPEVTVAEAAKIHGYGGDPTGHEQRSKELRAPVDR